MGALLVEALGRANRNILDSSLFNKSFASQPLHLEVKIFSWDSVGTTTFLGGILVLEGTPADVPDITAKISSSLPPEMLGGTLGRSLSSVLLAPTSPQRYISTPICVTSFRNKKDVASFAMPAAPPQTKKPSTEPVKWICVLISVGDCKVGSKFDKV